MSKVTLIWTNPTATVARFTESEKVGLYMAEKCGQFMFDFVPADRVNLASDYITEPFKVTYTDVYAHYQYTGTNFNFSRDKHPLATAEWDKAMVERDGDRLARELTNYIKSGV